MLTRRKMLQLPNDWQCVLKDEIDSEYFKALEKFVDLEYASGICYPPKEKIFEAFKLTNYDKTRVVILGQDPYHANGQAQGLCFSVSVNTTLPPSLKNIFKAIEYDLGVAPHSSDLSYLARLGVLLLNCTLTVQQGKPQSHANHGWENFTDSIMKELNNSKSPIVFLLWGANAQSKAKLIDNEKHLILKAVHPSPLSFYRGFLKCKHFSKTNEFLSKNGLAPIDWIK